MGVVVAEVKDLSATRCLNFNVKNQTILFRNNKNINMASTAITAINCRFY